MSHQEDITADESRATELASSVDELMAVFGNTPLVIDRDLMERMCCVMWINCFGVCGPLDLGSGNGLGFYLNVSRFNHSCQPDLNVFFDGARLILQYPSNQFEQTMVAKERRDLIRSAQKFNGLTISYSYGNTYDSYFLLRSQRRMPLKWGHFFECRCILCSDDRIAALEEHAAPIECAKCSQPFVWNRVTRRGSPLLCWSAQGTKTVRKCQKSWTAKDYAKKTNSKKGLQSLEEAVCYLF